MLDESLLEKTIHKLNSKWYQGDRKYRWMLAIKDGYPQIKRQIKRANGQSTFQRLPRKIYDRLTEIELRDLLTRLNYTEDRNRRIREKFQVESAFISKTLLEEFDKLLISEIPTRSIAQQRYSHLRTHFLDFFLKKSPNPQIWHRDYQAAWCDYLLEKPRSLSTLKQIIQVSNRFMRFLHTKRPNEIPMMVFKPISKARLRKMKDEWAIQLKKVTRMNKLGTSLYLLALLIAPISAYAECKPSDDACWRNEYKELCKYDSVLCKKLMNDDGSWKQPKWEVQENLKNLAPDIRKTGEKYGVDPRAIAAAVFAENSLNVTQVDNFEDFLVKWKIAKNGKIPILNKSFSFGWGQLYIEAARKAEPLVAKAQGRTQLRSDEEIAQALEQPEEAMEYIAGVMKQAQDVYAKNGIDISKKPEILATVYNLGKPEELVEKTKKTGGLPRVNFFGFFVEHYMPILEKDISVAAKTESAKIAPSIGVAAVTNSANPAKTLKDKKTAVSQSMVLLQNPPRCGDDSSSKQSEYNKISSYESGKSIGTIKAHSTYDILAPGLGCQLSGDKEPWSLIRGGDGSVGWVKDSALSKNSTTLYVDRKSCSEADISCALQIKQSLKERAKKEDDGTLSIKLATKKPNAKNVSWKNPVVDCNENYSGYSNSASNSYNMNGVSGSLSVAISANEIQEIQTDLQSLRKRMSETLKLTDAELDTSKNPYSAVLLGTVKPFLDNLDTCVSTPKKIATNVCYLDIKAIRNFVNIPIVAEPSYTQWKQL